MVLSTEGGVSDFIERILSVNMDTTTAFVFFTVRQQQLYLMDMVFFLSC